MDAAAVLGITGVRVFNQGEEEQESSGARRFTGDKDSSDLEPRLWFQTSFQTCVSGKSIAFVFRVYSSMISRF
ncbi:unnamed protein product [Linum tenue]|uniref:Uncharacterized protein n=1 Tax=Linum tenue TaxID=586396 RepID=A0AAV0PXM4_9ROSI|nr:unnamed protein product [Linum tenue]CAI0475534.1 unnamed protein product [Linum tenue]